MNFIPVILCGGSGSRLFPLSRNSFPKQFVKISNEYSLLQNTILRFISCTHIILISNHSHKNILLSQIKELIDLKLLSVDIKFTVFLEPVGKNTLPAITFICEYFISKKLLFLPCDHIYDTQILLETVNNGLKSLNNIVTFGIKPTYPETGLGYIETDPTDNFVNKFIEKPNLDKAIELVKKDNIFLNSGIFLLQSTHFINIINQYNPKLLSDIEKITSIKTQDFANIESIQIDYEYSKCESISIEYGIMKLLGPKQIYMCEYKSIHDISSKDDSNNDFNRS
jgi:mannose-1-phosphate guanylyltransferase